MSRIRYFLVCSILLCGAGWLLVSHANAQAPPDKKGDVKKNAVKVLVPEVKKEGAKIRVIEGKKDQGKKEPIKVDATVTAWVKVLAEKIADRHDTVRESARTALVAIGHPALPTLQKLAEGNDDALVVAAKKVMALIGHGPQHRAGPGGPGHFGLFGGFAGLGHFGLGRAHHVPGRPFTYIAHTGSGHWGHHWGHGSPGHRGHHWGHGSPGHWGHHWGHGSPGHWGHHRGHVTRSR